MYYIHIYCSNIICHWHWLDNAICIQVLDFYKRLSKALDGNPTIASADDMRTDGGELKKACVDFCCCCCCCWTDGGELKKVCVDFCCC